MAGEIWDGRKEIPGDPASPGLTAQSCFLFQRIVYLEDDLLPFSFLIAEVSSFYFSISVIP